MDGVKVEEKVETVKVNSKKTEEIQGNKEEQAEGKLTLKQRKFKKWEKRMKNQPVCVTLKAKSNEPDYYKELLPDDEKANTSTPRTISVVDHAENASKEIKNMMKVLTKKSGTATAMQTLPIHMRRRAASHNNKRLPRTIREAAKQNNMFMPSDNKIKKVCRKKRRAKVLLQNEYSKRAGKAGWLETHLWHAKRFKVTQSDDLQYKHWGCRIPLHPTFKNYRACYAGMSKKCNIQDVSYLKCLTVQATEEAVDQILENITLKSDKRDKLKKLDVEVELMIYDHNMLSPVCVGPGLFSKLQNPKEGDNSDVHLMIWLHPTILEQVTRLIEIYDASCSYKIRELCRFKLVGPKSSVMLLSTLTSYLQENDQTNTDDRSMSLKKWIFNNNNLVKEQNQNLRTKLAETHRRIFKRSYEKSEKSLEIKEGEILSAIVDDPRLRMPLLKTKAKLNGKLQQESIKFTATPDAPAQSERAACESCPVQTPLLDEAVCEEVCKSRLNDCKVSTRRNQAKLCGDDSESEALLNSLSTPIPLLVIAKTGYNSTNAIEDVSDDDTIQKVKNSTHRGPSDKFASGYDIVLPPGWSMAFWISFIYHQAMPTAQREHKRIAMECRTPHFPEDFPDTYAGAYYWHFQSKKNFDEFYRHSPNNRVNHSVLAVPHPFAPNWESLFTKQRNSSSICPATNDARKRKLDDCKQLADESAASTSKKIKIENSNNQVILTEKTSNILDETKTKQAENDNNITSPSFRVLRDLTVLKQLANILGRDDGLESLEKLVDGISEPTLVCFQLLSMNKGKPTENCSISLPCSADLDQLKAEIDDLYGKGLTNCKAPVEPTHKDPLRNERMEDSKKRKKNRKKTKSERVSLPPVTKHKSFPVVPSKDTIGFVTSGGFSNSFAKGVGIGFVNVKDLVSLYKIRRDSNWLKEKVFDEMSMPPATLIALQRPTNDFVYRYILLKLYYD